MAASRISTWTLCVTALSAATAALAAAPQKAATTSSAGGGYLEVRGHEYTPTGCTHNGNTTLCTFALVNRGNAGPVHAWPGDLRIVQLVDSSHVPHGANKGYFTDASGNHQAQLVLQPGDQGSLTLEFPNVGSDVTVSEFHFQSQIVAAGSGTATSTAAASTPATAAGTAATSSTAPAAAANPAKPGAAAPATASAKPAAKAAAPAAAASTPASTQPAACAANARSPACRAALQQQQVCAKNASSKACENATARAEKLEAAAH